MKDDASLPAGRQVEFKVGEETLRGSLFVPKGKGPFPGVVFYHGRGSNRKNYLSIGQILSQKGIIALAFDFRGCGVSDGEFSDQTHRMGVEDAGVGLKFLLDQKVNRGRIGLFGSSFGGYCAAMLLNDYYFIKSVILRAPASYSDSQLDTTVSARDEKDFFGKKENWIDSGSYKGVSGFERNLLVIESEKDEIVSSEVVEKYYKDANNALKRKLYIQKGVGHSLRDNSKAMEKFYKLTENWFLETL